MNQFNAKETANRDAICHAAMTYCALVVDGRECLEESFSEATYLNVAMDEAKVISCANVLISTATAFDGLRIAA